jgi:saccharopine dehydrogenase-like NADP-dependent oxidoreductase
MKRILVFGAGRSAYFTIKYLAEHSEKKQWIITVSDALAENLEAVQHEFPEINVQQCDVRDEYSRKNLFRTQDIVISLLPAGFHYLVALDCVASGVNLITPSYLNPEIELLHEAAVKQNITILNEIGLDPGIDHMSSMRIIHRLKEDGAHIISYKSYCGGLVSMKNNNNPWGYKFSWAPYNVIRAGQDGGLCLLSGHFHYVPYARLFTETEQVAAGSQKFESYLNRNSMHYIALYGLEETETFLRGTLRYPGYCKKWNALIGLGLTADKTIIENVTDMRWKNYLEGFLPGDDLNEFIKNNDTEISESLEWLFTDAGNIDLRSATPAENLQKLLERKWQMNPGDKDRVVMVHEFGYEKQGKHYRLKSWMDLEGEDARKTAMAKTVGLPLALAAALMADDKIKTKGVILPTIKEVYEPLLSALEKEGINFIEEKMEI